MMSVTPSTVPELVSTRSARSSPSRVLTHSSHDVRHPQHSPRARLDAIRALHSPRARLDAIRALVSSRALTHGSHDVRHPCTVPELASTRSARLSPHVPSHTALMMSVTPAQSQS
eukprot:3062183-Rhodomonas_salina.1